MPPPETSAVQQAPCNTHNLVPLSVLATWWYARFASAGNHSSTTVVNGQTFQDWFVNEYVLNKVGSVSE